MSAEHTLGERYAARRRERLQFNVGQRDFDNLQEAYGLLCASRVWDMTLPWLEEQRSIATLRRFHRAGFGFVSATLQDFPPSMAGIRRGIEHFTQLAAGEQDWLCVAQRYEDIDLGQRAGKLVLGLNVQDAVQIGTELSRVRELWNYGIRHMQLSYNLRNQVADGCAEATDTGLSRFGRQLVPEMNRVGMIVDCSHVGHQSSLEAVELSSAPVIFSHSGAYGICAHIRNVQDDQIRACAEKGGVIGAVGIGGFIGDPLARAESVFRHIDYMVNLVGPEHVGLGTDYVEDMISVWDAIRGQKDLGWPDPTGTQITEGRCFEPEQLPELVAIMLSHGYPHSSIQGILGENFCRVYRGGRDNP